MGGDSKASSNRLRQQAAAIADFGMLALRTHDLDALLQRGSALVADGLDIAQAKVLELLPGGDGLLVRAGVGWGPDVVGKATIGADRRSPAGYALQTGEPVVSADLSQEPRFDVPPVLREHGIRSAVNVIIRGEGRSRSACWRWTAARSVHFTQDDINFLQSCANLIAAAIDRLTEAKLKRTVEEKAGAAPRTAASGEEQPAGDHGAGGPATPPIAAIPRPADPLEMLGEPVGGAQRRLPQALLDRPPHRG